MKEERIHPDKVFYKDLYTQDAIIEEVITFFKDLYQHRVFNPDYDEIIAALGPGAVKMQKTECHISLAELSACLKKPEIIWNLEPPDSREVSTRWTGVY